MVQAEDKVGTGGGGHMQLLDRDCEWPHETKNTWQEGDGSTWHAVPSLVLQAEGFHPWKPVIKPGSQAGPSKAPGQPKEPVRKRAERLSS